MRAFVILALLLSFDLHAEDRGKRIKELTKQLATDDDNTSKDETISELINLNAKEAAPDIVRFMAVEAEKGNLWMAEIAAVALDTIDAKDSVPKLNELLTHKSVAVRLAGAIALRHMNPQDSLAELRKQLKPRASSDDDELRISAVGEIKQRKALEAAPDLLAILATEAHHTGLVSAAADALRELESKDHLDALVKLTKDKSPSVRYFAAEALMQAKPEVAYATYKELLAAKVTAADAKIPEYAGRSLLQAQLPEFVPLYLKLLDGTDSDLKKFAAETLGEMKVKDAGPNLIKLLAHRDADVRATAIIAIDALSDQKLAKEAADYMVKTKIMGYTVPEIRNMNFSVGAGIICPHLTEAVGKASGDQKKWGSRWLDAARCGGETETVDPELSALRPVLDAKEFCDRWGGDEAAAPKDQKATLKAEQDGCGQFVDEAIKAFKKDPKNEEIVALIQEIYRTIPKASPDVARLKKETGVPQEK